ncbi:MAG TPA: M28 family peptidase, partial [Vicinamibacteria bacterium]|nr:M28 family peptidase [Vicinamibacteria bacterium]
QARVRERLLGELRGLGYAPEVQETFACTPYVVCGTVANVRARLPGREKGPAVLLVAHYDSVGAAPGAGDDGFGVATLLEVARALKADPPRRNAVAFLFSDGEEVGLLGALAFVAAAGKEVGVVVNVDSFGAEGPNLMFETSRDDRWLVQAFASAVRRPVTGSLFYSFGRLLGGSSDLTVFKEYGLPGLGFLCIGGRTRYHTAADRVEYVSRSTLQHQGDNALAMARALAAAELSARPKGDAVFFDVLSLFIVWWPRILTLPLAALAFALILFTIVRLRLGGHLSRPGWGWGVAGAVAAPLAAAGLGYLLLRALALAGALSPPQWIAHPLPAIAAFWLLGLATAAAATALLATRAGPMGCWAGTACLWAAVAAIVPAIARVDSYPLLVPALVMGAIGAVSPRWGAFAGGLAAALVWFPMAWLLYDAAGVSWLPVAAAAVALAVGPILCDMMRAGPAERWGLAGGAASAAVVAAAMAAAAPPYSDSSPEWVTIEHYQDEHQARWVLFARKVPEAMRSAAVFTDGQAVFPWDPQGRFRTAPAPRVAEAPPEVSVVHSSAEGGGRRLRLHVVSHRGARSGSVLFPPQVRVRDITVAGFSMAALWARTPRRPRPGEWQGFAWRTMPEGGIDAEVVLADPGPVIAYVADAMEGLPDERLRRLRPKMAVPTGPGDTSLMVRRVEF